MKLILIMIVGFLVCIDKQAFARPLFSILPLTSDEKHGVADCKLEVGRTLVGVFHEEIDNYRLKKAALMVTCLKEQGMNNRRINETLKIIGEY